MNHILENGVTLQIHKGTDEIGGSCIELSTCNTTILLDYGTPLKEDSTQAIINKPIDAILISHPHQDHFGEIVNIDTGTPIYCGELSLELMNTTKIFIGGEVLKNNFKTFHAWKEFEIGDFKIKPYLVDHSATDAYAFLIEVNGKRILYSGDFRANGRKSILFDNMLKNTDLKEVDILLMEGTMLKRSNDDFPTEQSVEEKIFETISENYQISFMVGSSQNIDSIVSAYRACKRADKIFVVDMYTAWILEKLQGVSKSVPHISWDNVKVLRSFGKYYYDKISEYPKYFGNFKSSIYKNGNHIQLEEIAIDPSKYFLKISPSFIDKAINKLSLDNANIIYSQWLGYIKEEFSSTKTVNTYQILQDKYNWVYAHTSGHADIDALKKFAVAINPKKLIPIHTENKNEFSKHFENVLILEDNDVYEIDKNTVIKHILFENIYEESYNNLKVVDLIDFKAEEVEPILEKLENNYSIFKLDNNTLALKYNNYVDCFKDEKFVGMSIESVKPIVDEYIEYGEFRDTDINSDLVSETNFGLPNIDEVNSIEECIYEGNDCSYVEKYSFSISLEVKLQKEINNEV